MNLIFCVLSLVTLGTIKPPVVKGQELSDDEIIEALALLLSETEDGRQDIRRGRQEFAGSQERPVFNLDLDDLELDRASAGRQLSRQDFEDALGTCTTTGYEVRLVVFGSDRSSRNAKFGSSLSGAQNLPLFSSKNS